jgi:hypothetical protein
LVGPLALEAIDHDSVRRLPISPRVVVIEREHVARHDVRLSASQPTTRGEKQVLQADAPEQLCPDPVGHTIDDLRTVLRRVDMGTEWPFAERYVDDPNDRLGNRTDIGVGRFERREPFQACSGMPA